MRSRMLELLPPPPAPPSISLEPATDLFNEESHAAHATQLLQQSGYEVCGDYQIPEIGANLRGFFRQPNVYGVVYKAADFEWMDLRCAFLDDTGKQAIHTWTSAPLHDGLSPPWNKLYHHRNATPKELLSLMAAFEAELPENLIQESVSAEAFAQTLLEAYEADMKWRAEAQSGAEQEESGDSSEIDRLADELLERATGDRYQHTDILCNKRLKRIQRLLKTNPLSDHARNTLRAARDSVLPCPYFNVDQTPRKRQIDCIVGDHVSRFPVETREVWASQVVDDIAAMADDIRAAWSRLGEHCETADASKPSATWKKKAMVLIDQIGADNVRHRLQQWLPLINSPRTEVPDSNWVDAHPLFITKTNQIVLRGLIWCYSFIPDDRMPQVLAKVGMSAYRKIPDLGERAVKVGNACVYAIGTQANTEGVAQLALMKTKVKTATARKLIERQLDATAAQQGISREELEEISIPTYGMQETGQLTEPFGEFTARLTVDRQKVQLTWLKQNGKEQKSVPAAVKRDLPEELKELKTAAKDIEKMISAQKSRIESLYLNSVSWSFSDWKERYLDHPLVGLMAKRLLWTFTPPGTADSVTGIYHDGQLVDQTGIPLTLSDNITVRLWHPLHELAETVQAWRVFLEERQICQPFKQAHREVYLLTDAEQTTGTYSNRQAAHILSQAQYRSLAQARRWNVNFLGAWDGGDEGVAVRRLPAFDMRAEFWVSGIYDETAHEIRYVSTDQVRFYLPHDAGEPMELVDVQPIVFSEIMRDADLFVGVASVGNDPNWEDGGPDGQYRDYWHSYSFGGLNQSADTRREVLERLLPALKIADQCQLTDRFLEVKGQLRTYRIHLGSSNILMTPNDQYLCIVPARGKSAADKIMLPFEGDHTLSVILSKAFLLADDTKIKDPTILRQIQTG